MTLPVEAQELLLRPAVAADAYMLWLWANDAESRAASFGREPIAWEAHVVWLDGCLRSASHLVLIAGLGSGQPAGVIRFDTADNWQTARLSYTIAPEVRGRGLALALVHAGTAAVRTQHRMVHVRAEVTRGNERSLRVFSQAGGWVETETDGSDVVTFWYR